MKIFDPVTKRQFYQLRNGLTIILYQIPNISFVDLELKIHSGSMQDPVGKEGLAHFVEHLRCRNYKQNSHVNKIDEDFVRWIGEFDNAMTSTHETIYQGKIVCERIAKALQAIYKLAFQRNGCEDGYSLERRVILREYWDEFEGNDRKATIMQEVYSKLFKRTLVEENPDIIGTPESLKRIRAQDIRTFIDNYYHPGNATLFAVGNVSMEKLCHLSNQSLGELPPSPSAIPHESIHALPKKLGYRFRPYHHRVIPRVLYGTSKGVLDPTIHIHTVDDHTIFSEWIAVIAKEANFNEFRSKSMIYSNTSSSDEVGCYNWFIQNVSFSKEVDMDAVLQKVKKIITDPEYVKHEFQNERRRLLNNYFLTDWTIRKIISRLSSYDSAFSPRLTLAEEYELAQGFNFKKFCDMWGNNRTVILEYASTS